VTLTLTDADADGTVVSRAWDTDSDGQFDDGTGTSVSPALSGTAGAKTVRVRVTDDDGGVTTATKTVTLLNRPPVAGFTFAPAAPKAGQVVTLTSSATDDASIARQEWDLDGDGAYDDHTGPTATVTFPAAGTKTVALKVTDSDGAPATATKTIAVAPADTTGGGGGGGGGGGADTTPPHLTLTPVAGQKLRTVGAGGLKLSAGADEACTLTILLRIDKKTAKALKLGKKALVVGSLTTPLSGARTIVTVKLTSKAAKAFKKAKKPVKLAIAATATDPSANTAKLSASVSLKK
jgi:PKD repeat protein